MSVCVELECMCEYICVSIYVVRECICLWCVYMCGVIVYVVCECVDVCVCVR